MARFFNMKIQNKKIIGVFLLALQFVALVPSSRAEDRPMETRKLLVTAYYSPLPNQSFYIRGNYEADIRLNGRGTNGADGTEVYVGMLAAPKTYPFGTRVNIPGLGVGEVHDRGGAILAHKDYDRIDVWMGHGEEGLARALNWGARVVYGDVYYTAHQIQPGLSFSWVSSKLPASVENKLKNKTAATPQVVSKPEPAPAVTVLQPSAAKPAPEISPEAEREIKRLSKAMDHLSAGLGKDSTGDAVVSLQRMLWELGYYDAYLTGEYDTLTMDAVFAFQLANGVVTSDREAGAGYFGAKTMAAMKSVTNRKMSVLEDYPKEAQVWVPAKRILPEIASLQAPEYSEERQELHFNDIVLNKNVVQEKLVVELDIRDENDQVAVLQKILINGGYLASGLDTGYFGDQTEEAVLKFQIEKGIISSALDAGAGRVGPKTREVLNAI